MKIIRFEQNKCNRGKKIEKIKLRVGSLKRNETDKFLPMEKERSKSVKL